MLTYRLESLYKYFQGILYKYVQNGSQKLPVLSLHIFKKESLMEDCNMEDSYY